MSGNGVHGLQLRVRAGCGMWHVGPGVWFQTHPPPRGMAREVVSDPPSSQSYGQGDWWVRHGMLVPTFFLLLKKL